MTVYILRLDGTQVGTFSTKTAAQQAIAVAEAMIGRWEIEPIDYDHDTELLVELRKEAMDDRRLG